MWVTVSMLRLSGLIIIRSNNVTIAINYLKHIGYHVVVEKMLSSLHGVPQRRCRLYFIGIRDSAALAESKEDILAKLHGRITTMQTPTGCGLTLAT